MSFEWHKYVILKNTNGYKETQVTQYLFFLLLFIFQKDAFLFLK